MRRRPSASASRRSTWTAGPGAGSTPPSRTRWAPGCTTTSRWAGGEGAPWGGATRTRAHGLLDPQNNELLRDIFSLGPVLVLDAAALKACKISRFEKVRPLSLSSTALAWRAGGGWRRAGAAASPAHAPHSAPPAPVQRGGLQSQDQGAQPRAGQAGGRPVTDCPRPRRFFLTEDRATPCPCQDLSLLFF